MHVIRLDEQSVKGTGATKWRTFDNLHMLTSARGQKRGCLPPKSTYAPRWSTLRKAKVVVLVGQSLTKKDSRGWTIALPEFFRCIQLL